jgi:hypothetical protein
MVRGEARPEDMDGTDKPAAAPPVPTGGTPGPAMREAARQYVRDGEPLATFLTDLEVAYQAMDQPPPGTEVIKEASIAWADEFLARLDGVAFEDPLTGLSGPEHARVHLGGFYRVDDPEGRQESLETNAIVVVTLAEPCSPVTELDAAFDQSLQLATVGETIRATFECCDLICALGRRRVLAVVGHDLFLNNRAEELDWLLRRRLPISSAPQVLVRPMPEDEERAGALLDDLAT